MLFCCRGSFVHIIKFSLESFKTYVFRTKKKRTKVIGFVRIKNGRPLVFLLWFRVCLDKSGI